MKSESQIMQKLLQIAAEIEKQVTPVSREQLASVAMLAWVCDAEDAFADFAKQVQINLVKGAGS